MTSVDPHDYASNEDLSTSRVLVARSTPQAQKIVQDTGMSEFMHLDHDLGHDDTVMVFLKWLAYEYWDGESPIPGYSVHSSNPAGRDNIISFMETWWKISNAILPRTIWT